MSTFVLIHSPLTGPLVWSGVAAVLQRRRHRVVVPDLRGADLSHPPYWQRHVEAVLAALEEVPAHSPLILIGHSGAGVLLPLIAAAGERPIAAFLFVDAHLPDDGLSRLQLLTQEDAAAFRAAASGGLIPPWSDEQLRPAIGDDALRAAFIAELPALPLAVYEEPIPEPDDWDEPPCGYLRFSAPYEASAQEARESDWACAELPGSPLLLLTDPGAVTLSLILLCSHMGVDLSRE